MRCSPSSLHCFNSTRDETAEKRTVRRLSELDGRFDDGEKRVVRPLHRGRQQRVQLAFLDALQNCFEALDLVRRQLELNRIEGRFFRVRSVRVLGVLAGRFLVLLLLACVR